MDLTEAEELARKLMAEWLDPKWTFAWSRSRTSHGECRVANGSHEETPDGWVWMPPRWEIRLSRPLTQANSRAVVEDTIRHEIAHALTFNGDFAAWSGHGPEWQAAAVKVGAQPKTCASSEDGAVGVPPKWVVGCPACGPVLHRNRMTRAERSEIDRGDALCRVCCDRSGCPDGRCDDASHILTLQQNW